MLLHRLAPLVALAACGSSPAPAPVAASAPPAPPVTPATPPATPAAAATTGGRQLTAETALATAWGPILTVPAGWRVKEAPDQLEVQDPERLLTVTFAAARTGDRDAAIAAAWQRAQPGFAR